MAFQPSDHLKSRTFLGLILAQFLAAFNDQAIHASAMFYAIAHPSQVLTEVQAIVLMPILFYAPWALFCTLAGYLADRYSKRNSLVFWKGAEVIITVVALAGFWVGTRYPQSQVGPWIVLSTVFLMGTHSAFFVPAKYGVMPEILQPHLLSRGNGALESTSFLAVILGTVSGGILSYLFKGSEYWIGLVLVALALVGAAGSLLIEHVPAANPDRPFPTNLVKPLFNNLRIMLRARPLALAVLGIAFFTFMVAFMRATMYMHGESRIPRWSEFQTSLVVATVALGIGLGSPLAGILSGGKIELGLVPLGAAGMILAAVAAAVSINWNPGLIACLIGIGFCSGFYIVPLYTLLQHRAPKASKGDLVATSNFINVTGAILASLLFFSLTSVAHRLGIAPPIEQQDLFRGRVTAVVYRDGRPAFFRVQQEAPERVYEVGRPPGVLGRTDAVEETEDSEWTRIDVEDRLIEITAGRLQKDDEVAVSRYTLRGVEHYKVRRADQPLAPDYDDEPLPRYLFLSAALMTLGSLLLLCRQLPDFFVRSLLWLHARGRYRLKVVGLHNLPSSGPVILATNCDNFESAVQVLTATDRYTRFVLLERRPEEGTANARMLRSLVQGSSLVALTGGARNVEVWGRALTGAGRFLDAGNLVGVTVETDAPESAEDFLKELRAVRPAMVVPVFCGEGVRLAGHLDLHEVRRVRVIIGPALPAAASESDVRSAVRALGRWLRDTEASGETPASVMIPRASVASPTVPATDRPEPP